MSLDTETMLEYENQMFLEILQEDGLLISAKGLRMETILLNLIKVYCDPGNLVLVFGTTHEEEQFFISELDKQGVTPLPRVITADNSTTEREGIYLGGGVMFISSRILVVDLLKKRVPVPNITGFIVFRAHRILESCQEAFALRLYRQGNKTGFVKAFSTTPQAFTVGFAQVDRIMKTLFVCNLYLWPRFHAIVISSLEKRKPVVVELHLELTHLMTNVQTAILELVHFCIKEIKRLNPSLDAENITVENALSKSFHKMLMMQLDPIWHQLSSKTKQLLSDLKTIRSLLQNLTESDSVTFYSMLNKLRTSDYVMSSSGWLLLDEAELLFSAAKKRLYDAKKEVEPEPNPKWEALSEILKEIHKNSKGSVVTVVVLVNDSSTVLQLKRYLTKGAVCMLEELYKKLIDSKKSKLSFSTSDNNTDEEMKEDEIDEEEKAPESVTLTQTQQILNDDDDDDENDNGDKCKSDNATFMECSQEQLDKQTEPVVVLQQFKADGNNLSLPLTLRSLQPKYIIMYDVNMTAIRQIECYQSVDCIEQITLYFLMYGSSVEEQGYLTTLRKEKEAFEFLIKEKATMVISSDQDGKSEDCSSLSRDAGQSAASAGIVNSRKGGVQKPLGLSKVIVDMREFRSELPALLHRRGIDIDPVTLLVGDYILSPDMCVERKSINDLIGSLSSGRLYTQVLSMTRYYSKPILLIEFDQNKPFVLQGRYYLSSDIGSGDITAKLQLLTIHFPKLRIVWSPNPYATAQLFHELKEGKEEPDSAVAAAVGAEGDTVDDDYRLEKYNVGIQDFVRKLPGINTKNIISLLNKGQSLDHLITLSQDELNGILDNSLNAMLLYNALHQKTSVSTKDGSNNSGKRGFGNRGRRRGSRGRLFSTRVCV
ncbi:DNA repair endonuclease XPF mei-9 [Lycorma delicatula]|uniref:DNA repair endonuclease XPF mei-9 n=1 Tax=Lycorma delicatula TaxID=130591 RepID=UPI003F51020C